MNQIVKQIEYIVSLMQDENGAPYYMYGHQREIANRLLLQGKNPSKKDNRYPLIALRLDTSEQMNNGYISYNLNIGIFTNTSKSINAEERYAQRITPILTPIYEEFLYQLKRSGLFFWPGSQDRPPHTKIDRPFWGTDGGSGNDKYIFNDAIDAIEILDLRINGYFSPNCGTFSPPRRVGNINLNGVKIGEVAPFLTVNFDLVNSEGAPISPVVSGQTLTLPDVEVVVRYSNGLIAETFTGQPSAVNLDLTTSIFPPFEPEMITKIEYAEANGIALPTALDLAKENNFISLQKSNGIWTKLDICYWLRGSGSLPWKGINIVDPSAGNNITWVGGIINTLSGVEGNGVNAYAVLNWSGQQGVNFTQNNAMHRAYKYKSRTSAAGVFLYSDGITPAYTNSVIELNNNNQRCNSLGDTVTINMTDGNYLGVKREGTTVSVIKDNNLLKQYTSNSQSPSANGFQLFNLSGQASYSDAGVSFFAAGSALEQSEWQQERSNILASI